MFQNKSELLAKLTKDNLMLAVTPVKCESVVSHIHDKFNIPTGELMDIITQRVSIEEVSEYILFCFLDALDPQKLDTYFTLKEIKEYSKTKIEKDIIKFPLVIKCIQVNHDQWIGAADVNFYMMLRKAQMINYNENAQRVMKKIIRGEEEQFKIWVNTKSVKEIAESLKEEIYVPDDLTLNIPLDSDAEFYYDIKNCELVIKKLETFDISDGYHRYRAMCKVKDLMPEFNYPMELRITNFSDGKARQLIFQKDQKNKMRKIDSDSMNTAAPENIVIERLNSDPLFELNKAIGRNEGAINYAEFSKIIKYFYFSPKIKKADAVAKIRTAVNEIKELFNYLVSIDDTYLTEKYTYRDLVIIMSVYFIKEKNIASIENDIQKVKSLSHKINPQKFMQKKPTKVLVNDIQRLLEEV